MTSSTSTGSAPSGSAPSGSAPVELSVVIPVHNEAVLLTRAVERLRDGLAALGTSFEIWLAENGSSDATAAEAARLADRWPEVHTFSLSEPNYGKALKRGIERARGEFVLCEEIDLCDVDFAWRALTILRRGKVAMVIGSKLMDGARDDRPLFRHAASHVYSALLRVVLGFEGTDTHGLKAFRAAPLADVVGRCVVDRDVFASELVIRAYREGIVVEEVPVQLHEMRPPSVELWRRVPRVVGNLVKLTRAIGVRSLRK